MLFINDNEVIFTSIG